MTKNVSTIKLFGLAIFFLLVMPTEKALAQATGSVKGKVLDGETGEPLPFASVFVNNTSIGVMADSVGNYYLKNVPIKYTDLVFSFIGYESVITKIVLTPARELNIQARLKRSAKFLDAVVVQGSRDKSWKKNYDRFVKEFLGTGPNAPFCEIENGGIIDFSVNADGILKASASSPLIIYNRSLGYKIELALQTFEMSVDGYRGLFYSHFTELKAADNREMFHWKIGRLAAYKGSQRHFLKSLIEQRTHEEGFEVFQSGLLQKKDDATFLRLVPVSPDVLLPELITKNPFKGYYKLLRKGTFEIHFLNKISSRSDRWYPSFPHPVSWVTVPNESLLCPSDGIVKSNSDYTVYGSMGANRVADILPEDFNPIPEETSVFLDRYGRLNTIGGTIVDSASAKPLAGAHIFINNSLFKTASDVNGNFQLKNVPPGVYEVVAAMEGFTAESQTVDVKRDSAAKVIIRLSAKENPAWGDSEGSLDVKLMQLRTYLLGWVPSMKIINGDQLEWKSTDEKTELRAKLPLEFEDSRTGYKINYYLNRAEFSKGDGKTKVIQGFASFDTLTAKNLRMLEKWRVNRYELYHGSLSHFLKALVEGRTAQEGFQIFLKDNKKEVGPLIGDTFLEKSQQEDMLKIKLPVHALVRFESGKPTEMTSGPDARVSTLGILADKNSLSLKGPMEVKTIPFIPIDYIPLNESVNDPKVWTLIYPDQLSALKEWREKIHLHTDKDYYYPGEKLWYKAYVRYSSQEYKDSLSKVLYVELISPDKKIVRNEILKIENGVAWGDITLPDTLKPGNYFLRSYTRWALNYGDQDIFLQPVPILATDQNLEYTSPSNAKSGSNDIRVEVQPNQRVYMARDKVILKVTLGNTTGRSRISVSVTDEKSVSQGNWVKSILRDSIRFEDEPRAFQRISNPVEKEFGYDGIIKREHGDAPLNVFISSPRIKIASVGRPDKDARFRFYSDFYDTATFTFRASLEKGGGFGGHVTIEKPESPPITFPAAPIHLLLRHEDVRQRIKYAYDPADKRTLLDEVTIRDRRLDNPAVKTVRTSSIVQIPSYVAEGKALDDMVLASQDLYTFMQSIADHVAGVRYDPDIRGFYIRNARATIKVNNVAYPDLELVVNPINIERIEIYKGLALINIYLKTGWDDKVVKANLFDRYTLSGYATPTKFFIRDYSKDSPDNALPDLRSTLYWAPDVTVPREGTAVSFYAADLATRYRVVIEGLTESGEAIYGEQIIEVKN